jgi:hypothetical protein
MVASAEELCVARIVCLELPPQRTVKSRDRIQEVEMRALRQVDGNASRVRAAGRRCTWPRALGSNSDRSTRITSDIGTLSIRTLLTTHSNGCSVSAPCDHRSNDAHAFPPTASATTAIRSAIPRSAAPAKSFSGERAR